MTRRLGSLLDLCVTVGAVVIGAVTVFLFAAILIPSWQNTREQVRAEPEFPSAFELVDGYRSVYRSRIPSGWLVVGSDGRPVVVPDPNHEWLAPQAEVSR